MIRFLRREANRESEVDFQRVQVGKDDSMPKTITSCRKSVEASFTKVYVPPRASASLVLRLSSLDQVYRTKHRVPHCSAHLDTN